MTTEGANPKVEAGATNDKSNRLITPQTRGALLEFLRAMPFLGAHAMVDLIKSLDRSNARIEKQIDDAVASLKSTSTLVAQLEHDLTERTTKLKKLQAEQKKLSELASISKEQAEALEETFDEAIGRSKKWDWLISLIIGIVSGLIVFLIGVVSSDSVKAFIDKIFE